MPNLSEYKALIFDCDGTLVDSEETHFLSWRRALQRWDVGLTAEEYRTYVGKSGKTIAHLFAEKIGRNCKEELYTEKTAYYFEYLHNGIPPISATVDFVRNLYKEKERLGMKLAVASAALKHEIITNLEFLGIKDCFELLLSGQEDLHSYSDPEGVNKPKPYIYLHAAKLLGLSPSECVVIEDSNSGVRASTDAGCVTVAVPNSFTLHHDLSRADLKLESLSGVTVEHFFEMVNARCRVAVGSSTN